MAQDNIVDLQIGNNGDLVIGTIYIDYTNNTISGPGLDVEVLGQYVAVDALTLTPNNDGTYTIAGATAGLGGTPVAGVQITLGSQDPVSTLVSVIVNGVTSVLNEVVAQVTCFAAGTLIRTARGDVAVEHLAVGDLVVTSAGRRRPIRWLGHRTVDCRCHPRPHEAMPIRIAAHAFGENKPARDLHVSPGHSLCLDIVGEVLIPAVSLVNGATIQQVEVDQVTYWHVELDSHDILVAENMPAESYLDMGNRRFFSEGGVVAIDSSPDAAVRTHADFCRPFHMEGPLVEVVRGRTSARAWALGWRLEGQDPGDIHLQVDGVRVEPQVEGFALRFPMPADARDVWWISPTSIPAAVSESRDLRSLGACLESLEIQDGFGACRDIPIGDPRLCVGFHAAEGDGVTAWRWTAGRARLPANLWADVEDDFVLVVRLAGPMLSRWVAPADAADRRTHAALAA